MTLGYFLFAAPLDFQIIYYEKIDSIAAASWCHRLAQAMAKVILIAILTGVGSWARRSDRPANAFKNLQNCL